jgi:hypothetical protein
MISVVFEAVYVLVSVVVHAFLSALYLNLILSLANPRVTLG